MKRRTFCSEPNAAPTKRIKPEEDGKDLIGRDEEVKEIRLFLHNCLHARLGGSLYVCGSPGTGKTACLSYAIDQEVAPVPKLTKVSLNGNMFNSPNFVYGALLHAMTGRTSSSESDSIAGLNKLFKSCKLGKPMKPHNVLYFVLIDEVDQLIQKGHDRQVVLYQIFQWANAPGSNLILVGIANAIDLHDRYLPDLKKEVKLMIFQAYEREQLVQIMRFWMSKETPRFEDDAIELCARKIASKSGDVRMGLGLCRRALSLAKMTLADSVSFVHMKRALSSSSNSAYTATIKSLPLFQKYALCAILRCASLKITIKCVKATYKSMIKEWQLSGSLDSCELSESHLEHLQNNGIVTIGKTPPRKTSSDRSIILKVSPADVIESFDDNSLLTQLASGAKNKSNGTSFYAKG